MSASRSSQQGRSDILIVDDTRENLQVLTGLLQSRGYQVRPVPSGKLALQAARRMVPDLILLDIKTPEMDGFEVCRQLKADAQLAEIPVIFLSASSDTTDKVEAFRVGGVDYITKAVSDRGGRGTRRYPPASETLAAGARKPERALGRFGPATHARCRIPPRPTVVRYVPWCRTLSSKANHWLTLEKSPCPKYPRFRSWSRAERI